MKDKLTHNFRLKALSVFFAVLLWFLVVSVDDPITTRTFTQIPVELTNTDSISKAGKVYEVKEQSDVCSVTVTAKRSVLDSLSRDNFKATADMQKLDNNLVPIEIKATRYADRIENINLKNKNVKIDIENLLERQFNIQVAMEGELAEGYVVGETTLDKNIVKISGPESIVETIAKAEVMVDVSGMSGNISTAEDIILLDEEGNEVSTSDLTLSRDSVNIQVAVWETREIPITYGYTGTPAEGYGVNGGNSCSPATVKVAGPKAVLGATSSIALPGSLVDVTGATDSVEVVIKLDPYIPTGAIVVGDDSVTVHIGITPLSSKYVEVPVANITAINIPEGMKATVGGLGEVTAVQVKGLGAEYDSVDPALITGTVDLSAIEPDPETGKYSSDIYDIPVVFTFPAGVSAGDNNVVAKVLLQNADEQNADEQNADEQDTSGEKANNSSKKTQNDEESDESEAE